MSTDLRNIGLTHVNDRLPGIRRERQRDDFIYFSPDGARITAECEITRIKSLGIPPAYHDVWICPLENGHLQATGFDDQGRKQYRYHPLWQQVRSETKFNNLICFGDVLPRIRRKVRADLKTAPGEQTFTLAALVTLLDHVPMRVGNPEYVEQNETYGATTLLNRHVKIEDGRIRLKYRAKGGRRVQRSLRNKRLHRILEKTADLPGADFFTYRTRNGTYATISSNQLNTYLMEVSGEDVITAKTFRTWAGSRSAFECAAEALEHSAPLTIKSMAETASEELFNTVTVARNSYIHPDIIKLADVENVKAARAIKRTISDDIEISGLRKTEVLMLRYLKLMDT